MKSKEQIEQRLREFEQMDRLALQEMLITEVERKAYCAALWWVLQDD